MVKILRSSVLMITLMTFLLGVVYPLGMTGFSNLLFHKQAEGSLIRNENGTVMGSELIGQAFTQPEYFHGRPSKAGSDGYDAAASSGSNHGPTNEIFLEEVKGRVEAIRSENSLDPSVKIPSDLVLASSSGLDPHITKEAAMLQVNRISKVRSIETTAVIGLIEKYTEYPVLGLLGQEKVNVLELNMALDSNSK